MRGGRILAGALGLLLGLLVAAPASGAVPGEFFGLGGFNEPGEQEDGCASMEEACAQRKWDDLYDAGIRTWRVGIRWNAVQPDPPPEGGEPTYNWDSVNTTVLRAARAGIRTVPRIYQAPNWATGCVDCPPIGPGSPAMERWEDFVAAVARRYGRCPNDDGAEPTANCAEESFWHIHAGEVNYKPIKWWQVWEEPNWKERWKKPATQETDPEDLCDDDPDLQCKESAREYAELVRATHDAITSEVNGVPSAKILLGGLPEIGEAAGTKQTPFLRYIYNKGKKGKPGFEAAGIKSYLDGVALHPYSVGKEGVRGSLIRAKGVMKDKGHWKYHGVKTPLWLTEFGFASDSRFEDMNGNPEPFVSDPAGERRKLKKTFKMLVKHRTEYHLARAIWFGYHDRVEDSGLGNGWYAYTGLFFSEDCAMAEAPIPPAETREDSKPDCLPDDDPDSGPGVPGQHPHPSRAKPAWCGYIQTTNAYLLNPDVTVPLADCAPPPTPYFPPPPDP